MASTLINPSCRSQKKAGISPHKNFPHSEIGLVCPHDYPDEIRENAIIKRNVKYGEVKGFYTSKVPGKKKNGKTAVIKEVFDVFAKIRKNPEYIPVHMDIYRPHDQCHEKKPLLLFVHGGGFYFGDKDNQLQQELTDTLVRHGYAVASMNFRLGARFKGFDAIKMSIYCCVQDVRSALRYITHYADELNIDPERIYLAGSSSGGIIALTTAYMDEDEIFDGCKTDFFQERFGGLDDSGNSLDCKYKLAGVISLWGGITNLNMIDERNNVPALLFHGTEDDILYNNCGIPLADYLSNRLKNWFFKSEQLYGSYAIYEHMKARNMSAGYIPFDGYKHAPHEEKDGSFNKNIEIVKQEVLGFLRSITPSHFAGNLK